MDYRLIFYDIEVFKSDWLIVFRDYETGNECVIVNDVDKLTRFYNAAKDCIFCGYNNRNYDDVIFKGLLVNKNPYKMTQELIEQGLKGYQVLPRAAKDIQLYSYDVSTGFHSLKQLEGFLGINIEETSVPFDIDRKLTDEEIAETIEYCKHDVRSTVKVFEAKKKDFDAHLGIINMFNIDLKDISRTKTQLAAIALGAIKTKHDDEWSIYLPDNLKMGRYEFVKEWFLSDEIKLPKAKLTFDAYGVKTDVGLGGIHSSRRKIKREGIIINSDISSMYPATMINYSTLSRNVQEPERFREIRDLRLHYKAIGDILEAIYKLVINSVFGASGDQYNNLFDPLHQKLTCIYGQLFILDLLDKIENHFGDEIELLQTNTDGIMFYLNDESQLDDYKAIVEEWTKRSMYEMEHDDIQMLVQKDVNNYCIKMTNGKVKSKGAYIKKLNPLDYDLPIVNEAVREYLINGTSIETTINACDELIKFQKIYKLGGNYVCAIHNDEHLNLKTYRVFASNNKNNSAFYKLKKGKETPDKFAGTPDHCFIDNSDVSKVTVPNELDKDWYIDLAIKRVNQFLGIKYERKGVEHEK